MYAANRRPAILDDRLSADFYAPTYIEIETRINNCGIEPIRLGTKLDRVFKGAFYLLASEYIESGVPFIRVTQIASGAVDLNATVYISQATHHRERKTAVQPGNLLFAKGGAYRHCAVIPSTIVEANISQDLIGAVTSSDLDSHYAFAFLASRFGRPQLIRWEQGDAQPHLSNDSVKHILLPFAATLTQKYIGDKVRQAERLRRSADQLQLRINRALMLVPLQQAMATPNHRTNRIRPGELEPRLDAKFYSQRSMRIFEAAIDCKGVRLHELNPEISNGFEHRSYVEQGRAYVTVTQVGSRRLDLAGVPRIPESVPVPVRARLTEQTVLAVRSGATIGTVVKAQAEDCHACVSSHFIILRFSTESVAAAVATFLNSDVGRSLQDKIVYGGVIPQISQDDLLSLPIPQAVLDAADQLASWENAKEQALRCAQRLVSSAKILVEALIEGRLSEKDLVGAQQALERGDQTFDRAILARLTEDGIDVAGDPPLFANLDGLYAAIDEAQRIQPSNGDAA